MPAAPVSDITATVRESPSQVMTSPDSGVAMVEPAATDSRMSPSAPGETRSPSRTCGMRAAQLAKIKPLAMKAV